MQRSRSRISPEQIWDGNALAIGMYPFWTTCIVNWKKYQSNLSTSNILLSQSPDCSGPHFTHLQIMGLDHMLIRESFKNTEYWVPPRSTETEWAFNKSYGWLLFTSRSKSTDLGGFSQSGTLLWSPPSFLQALPLASEAAVLGKRSMFSWVWEWDKFGLQSCIFMFSLTVFCVN